jgi:ferritin
MSDCRAGRVNALAFAILDANGDNERLAEQMRFFRDLTDNDVDQAMVLAHWVKTTGGPQLVRQIVKPLGVEVASLNAATAVPA